MARQDGGPYSEGFDVRQRVIVREAAINSAIAFFDLASSRPTQVTTADVLKTAGEFEQWVWRDFETEGQRREEGEHRGRTSQPEQLDEWRDKGGRWQGEGRGVSEKQVRAIFVIGKRRGYEIGEIKNMVKKKFNKSIDELSSNEASRMISSLEAA